MTHGSNVAFRELSARGVVSSGSVMAPCPWFPETLEMAAADPSLDLGVHLTLNAEKRPVKWRPLTNPPRSAGLTDENGYFWPNPASVRRNAAPEAVEAELRAQIDAALAGGIDVTHLDAHCGAAMCARVPADLSAAGRRLRPAGRADAALRGRQSAPCRRSRRWRPAC